MGEPDTGTEQEPVGGGGRAGWEAVAACEDLERRDGRTVVYHEQRRHAWVQSDAAVELSAMR